MRTKGVYEIVCARNKKRYIGGSRTSIENRIAFHKAQLRNRKHYNAVLQKDWEKFGEGSFIFRIILICDRSKVHEEEQKQLDYWRSRRLYYNRQPSAKSAKGTKYTKEQRQIQSEKAKARCTPEWRAAVSARVKKQHAEGKFGDATLTPEGRARRKEKLKARRKEIGIKMKKLWTGEMGVRLRAKHRSPETREKHRQGALRRYRKNT
jgi:group I intron endonuclease